MILIKIKNIYLKNFEYIINIPIDIYHLILEIEILLFILL